MTSSRRISNELGLRVLAALTERGLSTRGVARRVGMSLWALHYTLAGLHDLRADAAERLAILLVVAGRADLARELRAEAKGEA